MCSIMSFLKKNGFWKNYFLYSLLFSIKCMLIVHVPFLAFWGTNFFPENPTMLPYELKSFSTQKPCFAFSNFQRLIQFKKKSKLGILT
jgi:hypothetical protein